MKCNQGCVWLLPERHRLRASWALWSMSLSSWDYYVTVTYRDPPWFKAGGGHNKIGVKYAYSRFWDSLLEAFHQDQGVIDVFYAMEYQKWRGVPHIHALLGGGERRVDMPRADVLTETFNRICGWSSVTDYKREGGAGLYISKYVTKDLGYMGWQVKGKTGGELEDGKRTYEPG